MITELSAEQLEQEIESQQCNEESCDWTGHPCWLPDNQTDEPDYYYCSRHAHHNGFCWSCGQFWGGVESFDFGAGADSGLCENCYSEYDEDEEDDMDDMYSTYPFDGEEDWH